MIEMLIPTLIFKNEDHDQLKKRLKNAYLDKEYLDF